MTGQLRKGPRMPLLIVFALVVGLAPSRFCIAQNPEMQQRVAQLKETIAKNKQLLAQYTWTETVNIILKGEQKKQEHFQVRLGPDGQPQKTSLDPPPAPPGHEGRLKRHIVEKKTEEYKDYADRMKSLIQQYVPPDREMIGQAYQRGDIMVGPEPNVPGQYRIVISNYLKSGDKMTLVIDKTDKEIQSLSIASYLDDPKDAVNVTVAFDRVPGGPKHVSSQTINGDSKQITNAIQNSTNQND